jgi:hypothetical protein
MTTMEDVKPMNKGVLILLERMSSNPDEFVPDVTGLYPPKWRSTILSVTMRMKGGKDYDDQLSFLSDEEIKALWHKMQELQGELFTKKVMNTLLQESFTEELSSSFAQTKNASCTVSLSGLQNTGAVSGTILGKLRYP